MTLKATSTADIVAFVPHVLGFTPADSAVLLAVHKTGQLGATVRVDLGSLASSPDIQYLAGLIRKDTLAASVMVIIYDAAPGPAWHERKGFQELVEALDDVGLAVMDALQVTPHGITHLGTDDLTPISQVTDSALNAEMIARGSAPLTSAHLPVPPPLEGDALEHMEELIAGVELDDLNGDMFDMSQPAFATARLEWECALGQQTSPAQSAVLLAHLGRKQVRDVIVGSIIGASIEPEPFQKALIGLMPSMDWARVDNYETLCLHLLNHAPALQRAELLAILGFIQWYKGRSSVAESLYEDAQKTLPGHRLSALLLELTRRGDIPLVAQSPATSYPSGPAN